MKKARIIVAAIAMVATLAISVVAFAEEAHAAVRYGEVTTASDGMTLVGVDGKFLTAERTKALALINKYRKEACEQGVRNPSTGQPLTKSDYKPIKWSSELEWIAQTRAAEATVVMDHTRPNGTSCWTISHNNVRSFGEVLAWNSGSMVGGCEQWYGEKQAWVRNDTTAVTGHYTQMIDPSNTYVGLGTFIANGYSYPSTTAGEFSSASYLEESTNGASGSWTQAFEVQASSISGATISGPASAKYGTKTAYALAIKFRTVDYWGRTTENAVKPLGSPIWSSSSSCATIASNGMLTPNSLGKTTLKASFGGYTASKTVTIIKGTQKISVKKATVTYKASKVKKASQTFKIGASASGKGKLTYSVTSKVKKKGVSVSSRGKVTVKKGTKKGTYKVKIKAAATSKYNSTTKTIKVIVK